MNTTRTTEYVNPIEFIDQGPAIVPLILGVPSPKPPAVDTWIPEPQDIIFTHSKGFIVAPITLYFGTSVDSNINDFVLASKRCYNSEDMRDHIIHYLNYFEKFYDTDRELISIYANMKLLIDTTDHYSKKMFKEDLYRFIMRGSIYGKIKQMTDDNYGLELTYKNNKNPGLQYNDKHANLLMCVSVMMVATIPLITHFINKARINANNFILECFDMMLDLFDVDLYNKLYETSNSNIKRNEKHNSGLWKKQDIRGKDAVTHSLSSVENIILNIMPKYVFDKNIIRLNFTSINNNTAFQVTDIG